MDREQKHFSVCFEVGRSNLDRLRIKPKFLFYYTWSKGFLGKGFGFRAGNYYISIGTGPAWAPLDAQLEEK